MGTLKRLLSYKLTVLTALLLVTLLAGCAGNTPKQPAPNQGAGEGVAEDFDTVQVGASPGCDVTGIYTNSGSRDDEISLSNCLNDTNTISLYDNGQLIFSGTQRELVRWCQNNRATCRAQLQQERTLAEADAADYGIDAQCISTVYSQGRALLADNQPRRFRFVAGLAGGIVLYGVGTWALELPALPVSVAGLTGVGALWSIYLGALQQVTNYSLENVGAEGIAGALSAGIAMRQWFRTQFNGRQVNQCPNSAVVQNLMELGQIYQD